jgi:hypothetical protein
MQFSTARLAPLDSPPLIGTPTAPTPSNDNSTRVATAALVRSAMALHHLVNGKLVESHTGNAATFAVKTLAGGDPSTSDPVLVLFPDASILTITTALSLVIPSGASIGSATVPLRAWFAIANDAGTPRLVVLRAQTAGAVMSFDPRGVLSATAPIASTACTYYSSVAFTNKPYRVIAFADYDTGIPTAGNWTVSPTRITMVGPDTLLPGAVVQERERPYTGQNLNQSGTPQPCNVYQYITPTSPINAVRVHFHCDTFLSAAVSTEMAIVEMRRNGSAIGLQYHSYGWAATVIMTTMMSDTVLDFPFSSAQQLYQLWFWLTQNGGNAWYVPWYNGVTNLREIMA